MSQMMQIVDLLRETNPVTVVVAVVAMLTFNFTAGKVRKGRNAEVAADVSRVVKAAFEAGEDGRMSLDEAIDLANAGTDTAKKIRKRLDAIDDEDLD